MEERARESSVDLFFRNHDLYVLDMPLPTPSTENYRRAVGDPAVEFLYRTKAWTEEPFLTDALSHPDNRVRALRLAHFDRVSQELAASLALASCLVNLDLDCKGSLPALQAQAISQIPQLRIFYLRIRGRFGQPRSPVLQDALSVARRCPKLRVFNLLVCCHTDFLQSPSWEEISLGEPPSLFSPPHPASSPLETFSLTYSPNPRIRPAGPGHDFDASSVLQCVRRAFPVLRVLQITLKNEVRVVPSGWCEELVRLQETNANLVVSLQGTNLRLPSGHESLSRVQTCVLDPPTPPPVHATRIAFSRASDPTPVYWARYAQVEQVHFPSLLHLEAPPSSDCFPSMVRLRLSVSATEDFLPGWKRFVVGVCSRLKKLDLGFAGSTQEKLQQVGALLEGIEASATLEDLKLWFSGNHHETTKEAIDVAFARLLERTRSLKRVECNWTPTSGARWGEAVARNRTLLILKLQRMNVLGSKTAFLQAGAANQTLRRLHLHGTDRCTPDALQRSFTASLDGTAPWRALHVFSDNSFRVAPSAEEYRSAMQRLCDSHPSLETLLFVHARNPEVEHAFLLKRLARVRARRSLRHWALKNLSPDQTQQARASLLLCV